MEIAIGFANGLGAIAFSIALRWRVGITPSLLHFTDRICGVFGPLGVIAKGIARGPR
jgi:hypothetical protein